MHTLSEVDSLLRAFDDCLVLVEADVDKAVLTSEVLTAGAEDGGESDVLSLLLLAMLAADIDGTRGADEGAGDPCGAAKAIVVVGFACCTF